MNKLVSIIIPLYNCQNYVAATIESALAQTHKNIEIIVIDDGSTDDSLAIVKQYQSRGIKVASQTNSGAAKARNVGLKIATGNYIMFLDADDILAPNKVEQQLILLCTANPNDVAFCSWGRFETNINESFFKPEKNWKNYNNPIEWLIDSWEGQGMMQTACWLIPREVVEMAGPWDESLSLNDDGEYFCRILLNAHSLIFCEKANVYYRSNISTSLSRQRSAKALNSAYCVCEKYQLHILAVENSPRTRHALMKNYLNFIYEFYPNEIHLIQKTKTQIRELGFKKLEVTGGNIFKILASIVGVERALIIRKIVRK